MNHSIKFLTRTAIIAALYFVISIAFQPLSFGPIQFRVSEVLTLLPIFISQAIPGLAIGCFFTNFFFSPLGVFDILFGTLATTISAVLSFTLRRNFYIASIPPMIINALIIPLIWVANGATDFVYALTFAQILLSQFIICGVIGIPLNILLKRTLLKAKLIEHLPRFKIEKKTSAYFRDTKEHTTKIIS